MDKFIERLIDALKLNGYDYKELLCYDDGSMYLITDKTEFFITDQSNIPDILKQCNQQVELNEILA